MCRIHPSLKSPHDFSTLGDYLAYLRKTKNYTLQYVVENVAAAITRNVLPDRCSLTRSYLSLLEAGKFDEPSPHKLRALAYVYGIPSEILMQKAGYLPDKDMQYPASSVIPEELSELQPNEQDLLNDYLAFLRFKRKNHCDCEKEPLKRR
ncbi:helix-turn-helix domain-containing protein [Reticulibacter mediterranei]|uniref:helix-turn-helix domain-containing protein n=1 Tax=Reticulibacter mediterranei TaxID=2778369 RepID=UPI001C68F408|nr:helix-turn-helix transcriptional regulator [Reticulibacter mediterranei]